MPIQETAFTFSCRQQQLLGIIHQPEQVYHTGLLVVVGGPQYRVGSHRQFLMLARALADAGIAVMRFDYRAMGDSEGDDVDFEQVGADIQAAIEQFLQRVPQLQGVVLWGLCDAASAILQNACFLESVKAQVLLNPWVRTEQTQAKTFVKHYYAKRILQADLWRKVFTGQIQWRSSLNHFFRALGRLFSKTPVKSQRKDDSAGPIDPGLPLPDRMLIGFERGKLPSLFILSGANDFVAEEFRQVVSASRRWQKELQDQAVVVREIPEANHTFSSQQWRVQVEDLTREFVFSFSDPVPDKKDGFSI